LDYQAGAAGDDSAGGSLFGVGFEAGVVAPGGLVIVYLFVIWCGQAAMAAALLGMRDPQSFLRWIIWCVGSFAVMLGVAGVILWQ